MRALLCLVITFFLSLPLAAQETPNAATANPVPGGSTLEDILARQRGEAIPRENRDVTAPPPDGGAAAGMFGTLGGASDSLLWEDLRFGTADISSTSRGPAATVLVQDGGMKWLLFREGPLLIYGGYLLLGTVGFLILFFLIRGRIRIDGEKTGRTITRFSAIERFGHWLLAGSFLLLGVTGLVSLAGRKLLIPAFGHDVFSTVAVASKWVHNNVSWAFMLALIMVFVFWVVHNLPSRTDINWFLKGGGLFGGGHPPAKKFNGGQKLIFWSVILLGGSISLSGLSLLFPFELPMFAATFEKLNSLGIPQALGLGALDTALAPHQEMQFAQLWHAIVSFVLIAIIFAHIYIGSVGMEGAYDAMGTGEVEEQWAREHHSLWVEEVKAREAKSPSGATPAE